ncbi:hypothetical protein EYB53_023580 [Candidatus Chloroploca sp. M-50]|uniref:Uncharacterized protein n=1 Tax=Candidatus Chloroploca mongolica TaxID=2528176 RepID=A0ABS4DH03_9CHLR|nr:hypothetical protein [Candidatus Chloroploca mongolica]MBP1468716.1 hypothetical protein [Candidatus Chloroploca mongolica]
MMNTWAWKKATNPDDVTDFLNGCGNYTIPVDDARICSIWRDGFKEYYIFYRPGSVAAADGRWGWKLATDPDDVMHFVNGSGAYQAPVSDARISVVWTGSYLEFLVFYRREVSGQAPGGWGWKKATNTDDVVHFLNGEGAYDDTLMAVHLAGTQRPAYREYYVFYQRPPANVLLHWEMHELADPQTVVQFMNAVSHDRCVNLHPEVVNLSANGSGVFQVFTSGPPALEDWLEAHPAIAQSIKWQTHFERNAYDVPETTKQAWRDWPIAQRRDLVQAFERAWHWYTDGPATERCPLDDLIYPPANLSETAGDDRLTPNVVVDPGYAWQLYVRWIAHHLLVELTRSVPWSLCTYDQASLQVLFDSTAIMSRRPDNTFVVGSGNPQHPNFVKRKDNLGSTLIGLPGYTFAFLRSTDIIGSERLPTILNTLQWASDNLTHFYGGYTIGNMKAHWDYPGIPPLNRIIEASSFQGEVRHWTAGCHGTFGFVRNVLRAANIPVQGVRVCGHSLICFMTEGQHLDHADNVYNRDFKASGFPVAALLIDNATYTSRFGTNPDNHEEHCERVGYQVQLLTGQATCVDTVRSTWASSGIKPSGLLTAQEWDGAGRLPVPGGFLMTKNDATYLYLALDLVYDTGQDVGTGDYFQLAMDVDGNRQITPYRDLSYGLYPGEPDRLGRSYFIGPDRQTGIVNDPSPSMVRSGFNPSPNSPAPHRIWEMRLALAELGVNLNDTDGPPLIRFGLRVASTKPGFACNYPKDFALDFSRLPEIVLARQPASAYPPGSAGVVIAGVGLIPASQISEGRATTPQSYYPFVEHAAFGGTMNLIGNRVTLQHLWSRGARKYRMLHRVGTSGSFAPIRQNWSNYRWTGTTFVLEPFGPDAAEHYRMPDPTADYSIDDLLLQWRSVGFVAGIHQFKAEFFCEEGSSISVGSAEADQILTLMLDNNLPEVKIIGVLHGGKPIPPCSIVNLTDAQDGIQFKLTVRDPEGHLRLYKLQELHGSNVATTILTDEYSRHQQELPAWNGVVEVTVPPTPWPVVDTCAYQFRLAAYPRVTNGYYYIGYAEDTEHVTLITSGGPSSGTPRFSNQLLLGR